MREKEPLFLSSAAKGCMYMIQRYLPSVVGKRVVVVVGQSSLFGVPVAYSLQNLEATVTVCSDMTDNLATITREADILVVSLGKPSCVKGDWIKPGALVIDVGTNVIADPRCKRGRRVVGDVDFQEVLSQPLP